MQNPFTIKAEKLEASAKPWFSWVNSLTDKIPLFLSVGIAPKGAKDFLSSGFVMCYFLICKIFLLKSYDNLSF